MRSTFTATKFGREYESVCQEDCAEFLGGAQFEIPYQKQQDNDRAKRLRELDEFVSQARDALRVAWAVLECGSQASLTATVAARGSVRTALLRAAALDESRP